MIKLGLIFGGMSTENEVSKLSAKSIFENLNKDKYDIKLIYISKEGLWFEYLNDGNMVDIKFDDTMKKIENIFEYLKKLDVLFPVLHGLYGEDGTMQGFLELLKIPYVGCKVLASSIGMDKVYSKIIFEKANLNQSKYLYIKKTKLDNKYIYIDKDFNEKILDIDEICEIVVNKIKFPIFVKPSNSGSSVGITKVKDVTELKKAIEFASKYDKKILIEEGIIGREVECAVLGNEDVISSCVGEVKAAEDFYSYDAKYNNIDSKTVIPAIIDENISNEIRKQAIKAFKAIDGSGLSRVDFFIENETNKIYINEINTLPGFTNVSMYPQLFSESKIDYLELLDRVIEFAL